MKQLYFKAQILRGLCYNGVSGKAGLRTRAPDLGEAVGEGMEGSGRVTPLKHDIPG